MLYVSRDGAGAVDGIFAAQQYPGQESLADDHKDIIAFEELLKRQALPPISHRQFYQALALQGLISKDEALAAAQHGAIPERLAGFVAGIKDPAEHFAAMMLLSGASEFRRDHHLVETFGAAAGMSPTDLDNLWREAATL